MKNPKFLLKRKISQMNPLAIELRNLIIMLALALFYLNNTVHGCGAGFGQCVDISQCGGIRIQGQCGGGHYIQ